MNDITEELRQPCSWCNPCQACRNLMYQAAAEIERLRDTEKRQRSEFVEANGRRHELAIDNGRLQAELQRLRDLRRPCQCGEDDQCRFARERDEARQHVARLEAAYREERSGLLVVDDSGNIIADHTWNVTHNAETERRLAELRKGTT